MSCAKFDWNLLSGSGGEMFSNSSLYFRNFVIISSWKRTGPFIWTWISLTSICLCQVWNLSTGSGEEDFFNFVNVIWPFCNISPWKRSWPSIWTHLLPLYLGMLSVKFGWHWTSGSGEEDFFNFVNVFLLFRNYLRLEKGGTLYLNEHESLKPKDNLCLVRLKFAQWFWRTSFFFKFVFLFWRFHYYLFLEKGGALHFK